MEIVIFVCSRSSCCRGDFTVNVAINVPVDNKKNAFFFFFMKQGTLQELFCTKTIWTLRSSVGHGAFLMDDNKQMKRYILFITHVIVRFFFANHMLNIIRRS